MNLLLRYNFIDYDKYCRVGKLLPTGSYTINVRNIGHICIQYLYAPIVGVPPPRVVQIHRATNRIQSMQLHVPTSGFLYSCQIRIYDRNMRFATSGTHTAPINLCNFSFILIRFPLGFIHFRTYFLIYYYTLYSGRECTTCKNCSTIKHYTKK